LKVERGAQCLPRRREDGERLVPPYLDNLTAVCRGSRTGQPGKCRCQPGSSFVPVFDREARISAKVRDQEGAHLSLRALRLRLNLGSGGLCHV
jgi:hypothetical protein